jgi:succinate-acetate transporter protein
MATAVGNGDGTSPVRVVLRPYGSPLPLGLFAFGVGMVVLAGLGLGLITGTDVRTAGVLLAAFVFPLELLAAVIAFLVRDTAAAATLGLFATSWAAFGALDIVSPAQPASPAVGMFLAAFAVVLIPLAWTGYLGKGLLGIVLTVSITRAVLAAAYQLGAPHQLQTANAAAALLLFALSVYSGSAFLIEDLRQRTVLPIARRGQARDAVSGSPDGDDQLSGEPGVRPQL